MAFDFKAATEDTSVDANAFLFGADSQSASLPSIYKVSTVSAAVLASPSITGAAAFPAGSAAAPSIVPTGDANTGVWFPAADTIAASTNGLERLRINNLGVGIGKTPAYVLDISAALGQIAVTSSTGTNSAYAVFGNTGGSFYIGRDNSAGSDFGSAYCAAFVSTGAYPMLFKTNNIEAMRIASGGNVSIGTTTPLNAYTRLHVSRVGYAQTVYENTSASIQGEVSIYDASSPMKIGTLTQHDLQLSTAGSRRMSITAVGNVYAATGSTGMTDGFFYMPSAAGAPSGTPTAISGTVPFYYDTTNNQFYVYNGAWKKVALA